LGPSPALLRKKSDVDIDQPLDEGERTLLLNFVTGVGRDIDADMVALTN
jgi:hypothetical protein